MENVAAAIVKSLANARQKGQPWEELAVMYLGTTAAILARVDATRIMVIRRHMQPGSELADIEDKVLTILESLADTVWEKLDRPSQDPLLALLSPGGTSYFFQWPIGDSADRLAVLVELLEGHVHPALDPAHVKDLVDQLVALLPRYRALLEEARRVRAKLSVLDRVVEAVAREGHVQHSRLRRRMREHGFSADEVREVFPDVPGALHSSTLSG